MRERSITRLFVGGLATDYCVRATGLDARAAGLEVVVLADAVSDDPTEVTPIELVTMVIPAIEECRDPSPFGTFT